MVKTYTKKKSGYVKKFVKGVNTASSAISVAQKAYKLAKFVSTLINVERKFIDVSGNPSMINTGTFIYLTGTDQGDNYNQRNGLSLKLTSRNLRIMLSLNSTVPTNTGYRIILYRDEEFNGTAPTAADMLETVDVRSSLNHLNGRRFKVIHDWYGVLNTANIPNKVIEKYDKDNTHLKYKGTSAASSDGKEGHIFLFFLSELSAIQNPPTILYNVRHRFVDN